MPSSPSATEPEGSGRTQRRRLTNRSVGLVFGLLGVVMVGAAYAAVPLYKRFCQLTGFDGTVRRADAAPTPDKALARTVTVRFDTNVRGGLLWSFKAEEISQKTHIGAPSLAFFRVRNDSAEAITGRASYNVTPETAGAYFIKTQCFCFNDQTIAPGQEMRFPVIYFVEPGFATDSDTKNFQEITLSYTFFRSPNPAKAASTAPAAKS